MTEELAVIDNLSGKLYLIVYADPTQPEAYPRRRASACRTCARCCAAAVDAPVTSASVRTEAVRDFSKDDYLQAVAQGQGIHHGRRPDAGADRPAHHASRMSDSPLSLYRALRSLNPSPYMYFYNFGDMQIVGASPEILVRNETRREGGSKVTLRPIAGTRPRGATPEQRCGAGRRTAGRSEGSAPST